VVNFTTVACRISSWLKWYKNYKNRLRLAEVMVKNKMSRFFYGSLCIFKNACECPHLWRYARNREKICRPHKHTSQAIWFSHPNWSKICSTWMVKLVPQLVNYPVLHLSSWHSGLNTTIGHTACWADGLMPLTSLGSNPGLEGDLSARLC